MTESEELIAEVVSTAQMMLRREKDKSKITAALIADKVAKAVGNLDDDDAVLVDQAAAVSELIRRFSHWIGKDSVLQDTTGHFSWLDSARKRDWRYWARYASYLERKLPSDVIDALDKSTDGILGLLEDPLREGAWDRRGLVVGHVQSGKTGNYSGLICKAADAGYKIIIVLAGRHNNLRSQTQIRLEESFLGYETSGLDREPSRLIGVGQIDSDLELAPNCMTTRAEHGDFNTKVATHFSASPEKRPWLFVVKKDPTVLRQLLNWIRKKVADATDPEDGRPVVSSLPLLVIDDEADNASVDTGDQGFDEDGNPDEDHVPKTINRLIRTILFSFSKAAFVGYTATPFANIFIHRRGATKDEGPDLFPQAFIRNLAAPSNYIGPAKVFGLRSPEGRVGGLPLWREVDDQLVQDGHPGWMPANHKKEHVPTYRSIDTLPPSLKEAICSFLLATAARVCRGHGSDHSSMLVHVTRLNFVQERVHAQIEQAVGQMSRRFKRGEDLDALALPMRELWERDFIPTCDEVAERFPEKEGPPRIPAWEEIWAALPDVLGDIEVRLVNGSSKEAIDLAQEGKPVKQIAVGGDKLSRGLTLDGLCTSYFVRTTKMYDTLMQMGRWFGYRPGYVDLCRLYTTSDLMEWFGHIADAAEELREEFDAMAESGGTPRDYGLKVQSHEVLLVTSPQKMRNARSLQLSFSGDLLETVSLHNDAATLDRNLAATLALVSAMGAPHEKEAIVRKRGKQTQEWKGFLWNAVPANTVATFFESYATHPKARKVNSSLVAEFIRAMANCSELTKWTVAVIGGGEGVAYSLPGGLMVDTLKRAGDPLIKDRYSIGRLLSQRDESIDLDEAGWRVALDATIRAWKPDAARQTTGTEPKQPELPNGPAIRKLRGRGADGVPAARERGLLLIYLLDAAQAGGDAFSGRIDPIVAFGASFPASDVGVKVTYKIDHLLWETEYGAAD